MMRYLRSENEQSHARKEEKQKVILSAAAKVVAREGTSAPISRIVTEAEIPVGSLYTHFADKEALLNALYLALKSEVAATLVSESHGAGSPRERGRLLWIRYIFWARAHPEKQRAIQQLSLSPIISEKTACQARKVMGGVSRTLQNCLPARSAMPPEFALGLMQSLIELVLCYTQREPEKFDAYVDTGFQAFWRAISE